MAFNIIRNDVARVGADAIVKFEQIDFGEVGTATATPAANVSGNYIISTVGPKWTGGEDGECDRLRTCYLNSLKLAAELGCETIAFPLVPVGINEFPEGAVLKVAISVFSEFLLENDMGIILAVPDENSLVLSGKPYSDVDEFINRRYVADRIDEESVCLESSRRNYGSKPAGGFFDRFLKPKMTLKSEAVERKCEDVVADSEECFLENASDSLKDRVMHLGDTWQETLLKAIDDRGYTDTEVYKRANVDRKLFSKIRSNTHYQPKKITAVAFALALRLNLDETKDFIGRAGYAFSPSSIFDLIIEYFIEREVYDSYTINLALFEHDQPLLGE